ncbi:MAG: response regulator [Bacilli bacterium]
MASVIVTDDAAFMRLMLKTLFQTAGYEVIAEAENGRDAVEKYQQYQPDLMTMDITMPEMDGIEAVRGIVSLFPGAKILMCSAMGQQQMVMDAVKAGAKGFIVKPFQTDRVLEEAARVLGRPPGTARQ